MQASDRFNPVDFRIAHLSPLMLTTLSTWIEHIPFAFALIEMLRPRTVVELGSLGGDSYCAFCQAIAKLKLTTRCTAIDTWAGDEHTGAYTQQVLEQLRAHHDPLYSGFSNLLRSTFDDARDQFADGSIDLLHIDGFHTYDAVKHDFECWLPKVSSRGVVLMHDTQVRKLDFGVWKLWEEVSPRFPSTSFRHGFGLGVLAVGKDVPPPVLNFIKLANSDANLMGYFEFVGMNVSVLRTNRMLAQCLQRIESVLHDGKRARNQPATATRPDDVFSDPVAYIERLVRETEEAVRAASPRT